MPARAAWRHSLFARLVATSVLISIGSIVAATWLAVSSTTTAIQQTQGRVLTDDATIYDVLLDYAATHHDWAGAATLLRDLAARTGRQLTVTDRNRRPLLHSGAAPVGLPAGASAVVDPLHTDPRLKPGGTDRIDERAVGPYALTAQERTFTRRYAQMERDCVRSAGFDPPPLVVRPTGRVVVAWAAGSPIRSAAVAECNIRPTDAVIVGTEKKALQALYPLVGQCLRQHGFTAQIKVFPDFSWVQTSHDRLVAGPDRLVDSATAETCISAARRDQLGPYVAPPALLFVTDPGGRSTSSFKLSRNNVERIAGLTAVVLAVTVAVTVLLAARLVRPLRALTAAATNHPTDRAAAVTVRGRNEIGLLAAAFNDLSQRRQRADEQRQAVVRDVAHELRTPVTNIRGWLEAVEDGIADLHSDPALASALLHETLQLQRIIEDLRDLAAGDAGELRLRPEAVPVDALLDQVATAHESKAEGVGVTLRTRVTGSPVLAADPVRLRQALGNLVSNAVRHTPSGGTVTLRGRMAGDELLLEVEDTGTGIAPADLPYVFDRFWRADSSRSRDTGGSGLGLAIVQQIAQLHGGRVDVTSTLGAGSRFVLALPSRSRVTTAGTAGSPPGPPENEVR
jgi:two-component system sensor histidine kinase BaeS